jgi:hypothetical protein
MRYISRIFIALLLGAMALPAWAQPEVIPPEPVEFDDVLEGFCSFDVGVQGEGKAGAILFEDRAILTAPGLEVQLTNLDTDEAVSLRIPGTFHDTLLDDEGNVRTVNVGRNVLFGEFDGVPGIFLTIGKIVTEWNVNDLPDNIFDVIESESPGKMIDVCAMLS